MRCAALAVILTMAGVAAGQVPASNPATAPATLPAQTQPAPVASALSAPAATAPAPVALTMPSTMPATTSIATTSPTTAAFATTTTAPAFGTTRPGYATTSLTTAPSYSGYDRYRGYSRSYPPPTPVPVYAGPELRPKPIAIEYDVLLHRSIFIRGRQGVYDPGEVGNRQYVGTDTGPTTSPTTTQATVVAWSPENVMVFNGASNANGQLVAFIENTSLNSIARFQVGDSVATGKIIGITLDQLDYSVGGRVTHVMLGQNLSGVDTQVLTTQPVTSGAGPSSGPSGGADDVLERLRRRRLQELGGQ